MEILEEILEAHKHLTRLLEEYLDDEVTRKKKIKKKMKTVGNYRVLPM
jgi:DNA topoisomerase VI subunit B